MSAQKQKRKAIRKKKNASSSSIRKSNAKDHIASLLKVYAEMEIGNWKLATPEPDPLSKAGKQKKPTRSGIIVRPALQKN
jgi:hypothetical protein